jgi:hypothetical protein
MYTANGQCNGVNCVESLQYCNIYARLPAKAAGQGCRARLPGKAAGQGCRARLPGKAAGQDCRARLPGKAAGQDCRARLPGKTAGQDFRARIPGKAACNGAICWKHGKIGQYCSILINVSAPRTRTTKQNLDPRHVVRTYQRG